MVIDPVTKELISHEQKIVVEGQKAIREKVKAEMHQAVVEVGTRHPNARLLDDVGHGPVTASALPHVALETLVVHESERRPCRRWVEIGPIKVSAALRSRLETAVEVVGRIHGSISDPLLSLRESWGFARVWRL